MKLKWESYTLDNITIKFLKYEMEEIPFWSNKRSLRFRGDICIAEINELRLTSHMSFVKKIFDIK